MVVSRQHHPSFSTPSALLERGAGNVLPIPGGVEKTETLDQGVIWTAHELRGPLVAARAALDHLLEMNSIGQADPELLHQTRDELDHMLRFVGPLLRCAAGVAGPFSEVDLTSLAMEVVETEVRRRPETLDRLRLSAPHVLFVRADPDLLKVALSNLVENALTYSEDSDLVLLSVVKTETAAVFRVEDRGPGVSPGEWDLIFESGRRGGIEGHLKPGHGLGLFIARQIVEAHGGTVQLARSSIGADFRLELPFAASMGESCAS